MNEEARLMTRDEIALLAAKVLPPEWKLEPMDTPYPNLLVLCGEGDRRTTIRGFGRPMTWTEAEQYLTYRVQQLQRKAPEHGNP